MKIVFLGGTNFLGPTAIRHLVQADHTVVVAHSGAHEVSGPVSGLEGLPHLHGSRAELLAPGGPVEAARPDVLVDTGGGREGGRASVPVAAFARRCPLRRIVSISSGDVYRYVMEIGMDDAETWNAVPADPLPIQEDAPVHAEFPPEVQWDNVRLERELKGLEVPVTILRPGMIYGLDDPLAREWPLVRRVRQGIRRLELPDGGTQFASRVSVDLVADAIVKALERAPSTWWACNVVDPYGWTYAGLAGQVAKVLDWVWDPVPVAFHEARHPFLARHPLVMADDRLRTVLGAEGPDPAAALAELIRALYRDGPRSGALYDAEPYF